MAIVSTLAMTVTVSGNGISETYNLMAVNPVVNTNAPGGGPVLTALVSGPNELTVPPNTMIMYIIPTSTSTVILTLKGITGDTGFTLAPGLIAMLPIPSGTTSVLVNASAAVNVSILFG